mmetsp:Transcript_8479/g.15817  ORF Transcript_8479/g.15817 Transcript_8479/m.15817 type:complete len:241 (+) Transcript_8479:144-866(+)
MAVSKKCIENVRKRYGCSSGTSTQIEFSRMMRWMPMTFTIPPVTSTMRCCTLVLGEDSNSHGAAQTSHKSRSCAVPPRTHMTTKSRPLIESLACTCLSMSSSFWSSDLSATNRGLIPISVIFRASSLRTTIWVPLSRDTRFKFEIKDSPNCSPRHMKSDSMAATKNIIVPPTQIGVPQLPVRFGKALRPKPMPPRKFKIDAYHTKVVGGVAQRRLCSTSHTPPRKKQKPPIFTLYSTIIT